MLILFSHSHGAQGTLDGASKATLENEFGTSVEEEIIKQIIEKGSIIQTAVSVWASFSLTYANIIRALSDKDQRTTAWVPEAVTKQQTSTSYNRS